MRIMHDTLAIYIDFIGFMMTETHTIEITQSSKIEESVKHLPIQSCKTGAAGQTISHRFTSYPPIQMS